MQLLIGHGQVPTIMPEASKIISKMKEQGLLEAVSGHSKGKYRFKI